MIASIDPDPGTATSFFITVLVLVVGCAASLTGGGRSIRRDAIGWFDRVTGITLLAVGVVCWLFAGLIGVVGGIAVLDVRADHQQRVASYRQSCEAGVPHQIESRKAAVDDCVRAGLED